MTDRIEWMQPRLTGVMALCAAAMFLGGLFFKTTRSVTNPDGSGQRWADGVKPWVGWAVLGGLAILALLAIGWWLGRWLAPAIVAVPIFAKAGMAAAEYRDRLEASFVDHPYYDEQSLSLGLRIVPALAIVGGSAAGLLAIVEIVRIVSRRRDATASGARQAHASQ